MEHFFAYINRTKYINRWGLMRNTETENLQEHMFQTAVLAHALAVIENKYYDGKTDPDKIAIVALYHDVSEIITGDMPTPAKYSNDEIKTAYKKIESETNALLLSKLPEELRPDYEQILSANCLSEAEYKILKAADTLSAYVKCIEEKKAGNRDFDGAARTIERKLDTFELDCLKHFRKTFLKSYELTIDEMN